MNSLDTSAVKLGALSDCMRGGVPCLANHSCNSNLDVVLDQLIEIPTLDNFHVKPNATQFVTYLLAREAQTHVLTNATTEAMARNGVPVFAPAP